MVMEVNGKKDIQFTVMYTGDDYVDFKTGETIEVLLAMKCILDYEVILEAYVKYDSDEEPFGARTFVKLEDQIVEFAGNMMSHLDVYITSRLIGNPVKEQLSVETLNWCLDIG